MNPSWKIDELARHVLRTAQWPGLPLMPAAETPSSNTLDKASSTLSNSVGVPITPTPHLDELERALDIYLGPLRQCPGNHGGDSGDGNIRTCTAPNNSSNCGNGAAGKRATGKTGDANGTWTWTPQPENANNSYMKPSDALANAVDLNDVTTLEELAPFRPEFYRALGELAREAFHPGSVKLDTNALDGGVNDAKATEDTGTSTGSSGTGSHHDKVRSYQSLYSIEQYSLPRMHDAYRISRVLLAMQDLHVSDTERYVSNGDEVTFLERLLHYCEGIDIAGKNTNSTTANTTGEESGATVRGKRIPILSAFFHHWSRLPQMEHSTQQLSRKYTSLLPMNASDYWEYCKYADGENDRGDNNKSWKESSLPSTAQSTTSFLGARSLRIDWLKQRLEDELQSHVNGGGEGSRDRRSISANANLPEHGGLVTLLSMLYRYSDASLRGKCRRWMGQWLRSFAIGSGGSSSYSTMRGMDSVGGGVASCGDAGLGPSFLAFCPLIAVSSFGGGSSTGSDAGSSGMVMATGPISITHTHGGGGGMPHNPLGMENTSACGIEALLKVLLRIIMGFGTLQSSDGTADSVMTDASKDMNLQPRRSDVLRPSHENLLFDVLLPLHRPSGMVLWRDQTPLIGLYHEALVKCIGVFLTLDRTLVGPVVGALLHPDIWPTEGGARRSASNSGGAVGNAAAANTPKVVLLLHEVDTLVSLLSTGEESEEQQEHNLSSFDPHLIPLTLRLCACISSENSRTSERALQFFKNKTFQRLVRRRLKDVGSHFLRALCRCPAGTSDDSGSNSLSDGFEIPWNPTVRKMTLLVLKELEGYYTESSSDIGDNDAFDRACEEAFCGGSLLGEEEKKVVVNQNKVAKKQETTGTAMIGTRPNDSAGTLSSDMTTLRGAMGSWRPPTSKSKTSLPSSVPQRGTQPPLTVTGVAPWAVGNRNPAAGKLGVERGSANVKQPPLTITGVAPWAINKQTNVPMSSKPSYHKPAPLPKRRGRPLPPAIEEHDNAIAEEEAVELEANENIDKEVSQNIMSPALRKVRSYMDRLRPTDGEEDDSDGISSWAKAQMEESPVLLPNLKFHDLVFGQELGTGAFSTVKYARQILKDRTRSSWPEFAVKIVSTQKIEEMGYEQSINREIAILRTMSHPGIARLISSFRFRDGAYLVLEYSSGGDLHTLLKKNGSLDHESTRFVIGSAAAAIWHIHQRGFVYADFKPENILITESGHIKVTDFGACRPVTEEAKALVKLNSKNLLQQLRDGDWKPNKLTSSGGNDFDAETSDAGPSGEAEEDLRIEGTTAYLPPEVVIGGFPTPAADVWAIGCVLFQCVTGRPPLLEDTDDLTAQRIVTFHLGSSTDDFFGQCDLSSFRDDAKALIRRILTRDAAARPDVPGIANDDFFEGVDIFSLHKKPAHPLDVGSVAPVSDAKWSRRQFSSIWAPQPQAYVIGGDLKQSSSKQNNSLSNPIPEGDEADTMFSSATKAPLLGKIRELD